MKKILSALLVLLFVVGSVFCITGCTPDKPEQTPPMTELPEGAGARESLQFSIDNSYAAQLGGRK